MLSCEKKAPEKVVVKAQKASSGTFVQDSTKIKFTAYKLTRKVGVNGVFDVFTISNVKKGNSVAEMFTGATFSIPISGLNTGMPARDTKIRKFFFDILKSSDVLTGSLKSVEGNTGVMEITLNERTTEVNVKISRDGANISVAGKIDLEAHHAQNAIAALNAACGKNHIGEDGIPKMWPDVDFEITTVLQ